MNRFAGPGAHRVARSVTVPVLHSAVLGALLGGSLAALAGCYEIKPHLDDRYVGGPTQPGWPPLPVYHPDPFHPLNRLFQRLFVLGENGQPALERGPGPLRDPPFPARRSLGLVDRAEVLALLRSKETAEGLRGLTDPSMRALVQSDLLLFTARVLGEKGSVEVREALAGAARGLAGAEGLPPLDLPPLGEAEWEEGPGPRTRGLRPSLHDLRWTRVLRRRGESLLLRLRVGMSAAGEPVLLPLPVEAWHLAAREGGQPRARLFHLRRARLLEGRQAWEEAPAGQGTAVLDPEDPFRPALSGEMPGLCTGCHPGPGLEARPAAAHPSSREPAASPATGEEQREEAGRVLKAILGG